MKDYKEYKDLSDQEKDEYRKTKSNGCGGKGSFKPPRGDFFDESCVEHDYNYDIPPKTFLNRFKADNRLLVSMFKAAWEFKPRYLPWCVLYYIGVRIGGGRFYYTQNEDS